MATIAQAVITDDLDYVRHGDRPLMLRLFRPMGAGPFPVIVVLHAGGWAHGDLTGCQAQGDSWARAEFAVASLDFRLGPDKYPSSLIDINYGVRWLKAHGRELELDPERVALSGFSSGVHLAMLAAMRPDDPRYTEMPVGDGSSSVDATVRCVGVAWPVINPL